MSGFRVTRYRVRIEDEKRRFDQPFTAVLLTDLHNMSYGENNSELLAEIRNQAPEIVFAAGDLVTGVSEPQTEFAVRLMKDLTNLYPVYYSNGNHEQRMKEYPERYNDRYEPYRDTIRSFGVHLLENACEKIEVHRMPVHIRGYEIPMECYRRGRRETLDSEHMKTVLGEPDPNAYQILLAHNPLFFPAYAQWGADLTLSGHLHGGIVRIPFLGGLISPQLRPFPKYTKGLYTENGKKMIVSAGLGSHTIKLRINNPPELVVIDFV